jgi:excisionase family DNA binding protein
MACEAGRGRVLARQTPTRILSAMTLNPSMTNGAMPQKQTPTAVVLLTSKEAAWYLKVSQSWLAKARMRGDGPPYMLIGRAVRYSEAALLQWMKSRQRLSTSER